MRKPQRNSRVFYVLVSALAASFQPADSLAEPTKVTAFNFVRAESDYQLAMYAERSGGIGKLHHSRAPYPVEPDKQITIRGNRDTLYSMGVFDLTTPLVITKPASPNRFQSMMTINQHHSASKAEHGPGTFTITLQDAGSRYILVVIRTFANPDDPADMKAAHALQDAIRIEQLHSGSLELPAWDNQSRIAVRNLLNEIGKLTITDFSGYFGRAEDIDPIKYVLGASYGWGGNREEDAMYSQVTPENNDGNTPYALTFSDVPVDGFWSVTVYNNEGFFEQNKYDAYSFNSMTAEPNADHSYTIHFGGDSSARNFLPITPGWNYTLRMYQPRQEVIDGTWTFPAPSPLK